MAELDEDKYYLNMFLQIRKYRFKKHASIPKVESSKIYVECVNDCMLEIKGDIKPKCVCTTRVLVCLVDDKANTDICTAVRSFCLQSNINRSVIISNDINPSFARHGNIVSEVFNHARLKICPPRHVRVPKHEILLDYTEIIPFNEKTHNNSKENIDLAVSKLPCISIEDPVIRYYGWVKGVVKIHSNPLYYRRIVE